MIDSIIVGQGIAGTCLALQHFFHKKSFLLIDKSLPGAASVVSSGLVNPITGRRFSLAWKVNELISYAKEFYKKSESFLQDNFFYEQRVYRILHDVKQQNDVAALQNTAEYFNFLSKEDFVSLDEEKIYNPFQSLLIENAFRIDVNHLIKSFEKKLLKNELKWNEAFDDEKLVIENDFINYKGVSARNIIFCTGFYQQQSPFFKNCKLIWDKGHSMIVNYNLDIQGNTIVANQILSQIGEKKFFVGATHQWQPFNLALEENQINKLQTDLHRIIRQEAEIVKRQWGIRPTVQDRKPILGSDAQYKNVFLLNGMGTKGVSLAPYFSAMLFRHIFEGKEIDLEVSTHRFNS